MSNELLRIHDENNNCDLVAVANPMGNFHMSTYAEMEDGTVKPVDGWYLFSKMIEKLGQGGNAYDAVIYYEENDGYSVDGDFNDCLTKARNGNPLTIALIDATVGVDVKLCCHHYIPDNEDVICLRFFEDASDGVYAFKVMWSENGAETEG